MKKILTSLCLLSACSCAFAYVHEGTTSDVETLGRQNYSESTLKVIDTYHQQAMGEDRVYEARYAKDKDASAKKATQMYRKVKYYFDPLADDGTFGRREINFDNKFFYDAPKKDKPEARKYEYL